MTRTHEEVTADINATVARLNELASEMPDYCIVEYAVGEIQSPRRVTNGYITATIHLLEIV